MQLAEQIKTDVTSAMKAGERDRVSAVRLVLSGRADGRRVSTEIKEALSA